MNKVILSVCGLLSSYGALATTDIPISTNRSLVNTDSPLLFAYHDKESKLAALNLASMEFAQLTLPDNAFGFDYGKLAGSDAVTAFVLAQDGIYSVDGNGAHKVLATNSLLSKLEFDEFEKINFINDINNDGLSDIILPNLTHSEIFIQQADKTFKSYTFKTEPKFSGNFRDSKLKLDIDLTLKPKVFDVNNDGFSDLVFYDTKQIQVLYANKAGYGEALTSLTLPVETGKLKDQEANRRISQVLDINADGKLDIVTRFAPIVQGMDSLDVDITYAVHYGQGNGQLAKTPITLPTAKGTTNFEFKNDFTGNGKVEMQKFHVDFGLGTIASMALGGGSADVDVEISFYKQHADGSFSTEPDNEKEVEMEIKMDGDGMPMTYYSGDLNGDGLQDAVFKTGSKTLSVYYGHSERVLNKKRKKIKHKLPDNSNDILLVDINNDGKKDFVFKFTDDDGKSTIKTLLN